MFRSALATGTLLVGFMLSSPLQAGDFSRFLDLDIEDVAEMRGNLGRMMRSPDRAITELKQTLGDDDELDVDERLLAAPGKQNRSQGGGRQAIVASSKAVKRAVAKEIGPEQPAAVQGTSDPVPQPKTRSANCLRFVPIASTTISIDCSE